MEKYRNEIMEFCERFLNQKSKQKKVDYCLGDKFRIYCDDFEKVLIIEYNNIEAVRLLYTEMDDHRVLGRPNIVGNIAFSIECSEKFLKEICKIVGNSNLVVY